MTKFLIYIMFFSLVNRQLLKRFPQIITKWILIWFCLHCFRENSSSVEGLESDNSNKKRYEVNDNVKRKQSEVVCESQHPNKSPKNDQGGRQSSPSSSSGSFKKPTGDKLDWNVLRPSSVKQNGGWVCWLFDCMHKRSNVWFCFWSWVFMSVFFVLLGVL